MTIKNETVVARLAVNIWLIVIVKVSCNWKCVYYYLLSVSRQKESHVMHWFQYRSNNYHVLLVNKFRSSKQ